MLGTVGNRDSTVVEGVDEKLFSEEKLSEKIPEKNTGKEKIGEGSELPGTGTGVLRYMHAGGVGGGMWRDQRVSVLLLDPVRKGVGESRAEKETEVGVKRAVPSVPIRALTDQRLWARWVLGTT
jgi:hypothetical protein